MASQKAAATRGTETNDDSSRAMRFGSHGAATEGETTGGQPEVSGADPGGGDESREADSAGQPPGGGDRVGGDERQSSRGSVPNLNFRFPDTCKRFPPPSNSDVERSLHKLKVDIVRAYKGHKPDHCNVTRDEKEFIKELSKN